MSDDCERCGHDDSYHWLEHATGYWVCAFSACACREPASSRASPESDLAEGEAKRAVDEQLEPDAEADQTPSGSTDKTVYGVWEFHDLVGLYATPQLADRRKQQVIRKLREREPDEDDWDSYVTVSPMLVHGESR